MKSPFSFFHWIPRIICIIDILFISIFALDAFRPNAAISDQLKDFFIHLIPSFILIAVLILAWKKEFLGGLLFMVIGIVLSPYVYSHNYTNNHSFQKSFAIISLITFPFIVVGLLFILSSVIKQRNKK